MNIFGKRLETAIKNKKLTQDELAKQIGTSQATINRWTKGINQPDVDAILMLCNILEEDPNYLLGYDLMESKRINISLDNNKGNIKISHNKF